MRVAIIDLGTNTFNLLVAEEKDRSYTILYSGKEPVMLGREGLSNQLLHPDAIGRALTAVSRIFTRIRLYRADSILAIGTSALRHAGNVSELTGRLKQEFGLDPEIITGEEEAEYIFHGVAQAVRIDKNPALILDIGGGSNEFIFCQDQGILWKKSYENGMARLIERFQPSDPVTPAEETRIRDFLKEDLEDLFEMAARFQPSVLVGASGSFDTLRSMLLARHNNQPVQTRVPHQEIGLNLLDPLSRELIRASTAERLAMKGMEPIRAEMIGLACILIGVVMQETGINRLIQSDYSLKEGVISRKLHGKIHWN